MTAYRAFFKYICGTLLGSDFYSVKIRAPSAGRANGAECNTPGGVGDGGGVKKKKDRKQMKRGNKIDELCILFCFFVVKFLSSLI